MAKHDRPNPRYDDPVSPAPRGSNRDSNSHHHRHPAIVRRKRIRSASFATNWGYVTPEKQTVVRARTCPLRARSSRKLPVIRVTGGQEPTWIIVHRGSDQSPVFPR
jgi:hypothetical protein